jgi:prepilin-type N-terminal cleavage/methylation domain-containing protein
MIQKYKHVTGFTIVELLIVIVIIGVLAAITVVAYNGIQDRTANTTRIAEIKEWQKLFNMYATENGQYPFASGAYCLGTGFPDDNADGVGDCWDINVASNRRSVNASLNSALAKYGSLPNFNRTPVPGTSTTIRMGPVATWEGGTLRLVYWLKGSDNNCQGNVLRWNDGASYACHLVLPTL